MIVCSCNVLSDHEVRDLVTASGSHSLTAHEVYGCLGCNMLCGRCARAVKRILNETLANRAGAGAGRPAKRPSDKVDCSISVTIHGGDSVPQTCKGTLKTAISDRQKSKSCLHCIRPQEDTSAFPGIGCGERLVAEVLDTATTWTARQHAGPLTRSHSRTW